MSIIGRSSRTFFRYSLLTDLVSVADPDSHFRSVPKCQYPQHWFVLVFFLCRLHELPSAVYICNSSTLLCGKSNLDLLYSKTDKCLRSGVANPHHLSADPDLSFHFNADADPIFHFDADWDPDPNPHQSDVNLRLLV